MAGIGHNNGPTMEPGFGWRHHSWTQARAALLPRLPIEVVRLRVKRAQALGLPYQTYAGIRAHTGHDVVGFLFSSNALGMLRARSVVPDNVTAKLVAIAGATRVGLFYPGIDLTRVDGLDLVRAAPAPHATWSEMRGQLQEIISRAGHPADRFVMIGDTPAERDWAEAGRTAGFLRGPVYFGATG